MPSLSVNIDHVATVRQARRTYEPDPVMAAIAAQRAGAAGITVHLREDRRHIQDADLPRLKDAVTVRLNLEMAATDEMVRIACDLKPHMAMLVPEGRQEITTEGGLDVVAQRVGVKSAIARLKDAGIGTSIFIDADERQIDAAAACGADVCEVHTGPYAHRFHARQRDFDDPQVRSEFDRVAKAGATILAAGMRFNAGHALNYANVPPIAALPGLSELHIGHSIVSRAVLVGFPDAVREMVEIISAAATNP